MFQMCLKMLLQGQSGAEKEGDVRQEDEYFGCIQRWDEKDGQVLRKKVMLRRKMNVLDVFKDAMKGMVRC